ncbi:MAG: amidophosphoribosyltransferase, partial [Faecalibacterium sp.]
MSDFAYPLHEECGVFGIYDRAGTEDVAAAAYSALYALQHRGQESCGIAVNEDGVITGHRDLGLVNEVFTPAVLASISSPAAHMATGHVRYATAGSRVRANAQPMIVRHGRGTMALCHNGNLTNALELRRQLENEGAIFHGSSDTEVICYLVTRNRLRMGSIETAISKTMDVLQGAYSLVIMSSTKLIAVRDPRGYRPLCIGALPGGGYVFASESCALDAAGATLLRDVEPGEIVVVDARSGELRSIKDHCGRKDTQMCVFEYIYFSRPDSIIEGCSVHEARKQAGRFLAQEHPVEADVVIGVPDSGLDAALGYSEESGIPYGIGFIKNKYIGRTFIQGSQKQRENSVRIKLNVVSSTVKGKR